LLIYMRVAGNGHPLFFHETATNRCQAGWT